MTVSQRNHRSRLAARAIVREGIVAEAIRQLNDLRPKLWIAPNPSAHTRAGYFAAQGLPVPVGCGPDGRMAA